MCKVPNCEYVKCRGKIYCSNNNEICLAAPSLPPSIVLGQYIEIGAGELFDVSLAEKCPIRNKLELLARRN